MSKTDAAVLEAVESFVEQLKRLIQQAAMESVEAALTGGKLSARSTVKAGRAALTSGSKRPQNGAKRTPEELDALIKMLRAYVAKNPGQRIEQIGRSLDLPTKELVLPVKKLLSQKQLSTKGQKRATTYFSK